MVERGIVDEEEAKDDEFEAMDYIDDFVVLFSLYSSLRVCTLPSATLPY